LFLCSLLSVNYTTILYEFLARLLILIYELLVSNPQHFKNQNTTQFMNCEINLYDNVKNPDVKGKMNIEDILQKIKNPDENTKDEIKSARFILKKLGKEQYDKVKKNITLLYFQFLIQ